MNREVRGRLGERQGLVDLLFKVLPLAAEGRTDFCGGREKWGGPCKGSGERPGAMMAWTKAGEAVGYG